MEKETKIFLVRCEAIITGEYETVESASATFKENIEQGNYQYVVHEVKDEEVA